MLHACLHAWLTVLPFVYEDSYLVPIHRFYFLGVYQFYVKEISPCRGKSLVGIPAEIAKGEYRWSRLN
jgi:hypothetical protein